VPTQTVKGGGQYPFHVRGLTQRTTPFISVARRKRFKSDTIYDQNALGPIGNALFE
jgi:hypothetical protein